MFDTIVTIVGNVLTQPEWRRTKESNQLVANFRLVSTARRFDRESQNWVDGNSLRIRVSAWRRLAEGIASSIGVGDPVVVHGRIYSRDWDDEAGNHRITYEMEAHAIGHDLSRGRARFYRMRPHATNSVEDAESEAMVGGELAEPVLDAPVGFGDGLPDLIPGELEPDFLEVVAGLTEDAETESPENGSESGPEPEPSSENRRTRRPRREPVAA